ncbi:MAG TPA: tetratricopeptide repeat protein [Rectinemataceae bacterium]|nr:tetratricopeptide repeat protein [Rectinemataceae bacterium]
MKKPFILALALFSTMLVAGQEKTPTAILLPFVHDATISDPEAEFMLSALSSDLLEQGVFDFIDPSRLADAERTLNMSGASNDVATALGFARATKAEFVMVTRIGASQSKGRKLVSLTMKLIAADSGKEIFGRTQQFLASDQIQAIGGLSKRIAVAVRQRSDVTLEQIDIFIKAEDWSNAQHFIDLFAASNSRSISRVQARQSEVNRGMARALYAEAQSEAGLFHYEEAIQSISKAKRLDPSNGTYAAYETSLIEENQRFMTSSETSLLDKVESLINERRYAVASALLDTISSGGKSIRAENLKTRADNGVKAEHYAGDSATLLDTKAYADALRAIDQALSLVPDDPGYLRLRVRILDTEKRDAAMHERWQLYITEMKSFDYGRLFVSTKEQDEGLSLQLAMLYLSTQDYDISPGQSSTSTRGPLLGISGTYFRPLIRLHHTPFSFSDFEAGWMVGASVNGGTWRTIAADQSDIEDSVLLTDLTIGASARFSFVSYYLQAALGAGPGFLYIDRTAHVPFASGGTDQGETSVFPELGYSLALGWLPADRFSLSLCLTSKTSVFAPEKQLSQSPNWWSLGLQCGFSL